ncbi:MAG: YdcH family protein [Bosea sp. (in: a-proteobacteria)]
MTDDERVTLQRELSLLEQDHRDLDAAIDALVDKGTSDQLQMQRLKKRKLMLRDRMVLVQGKLMPDIIA